VNLYIISKYKARNPESRFSDLKNEDPRFTEQIQNIKFESSKHLHAHLVMTLFLLLFAFNGLALGQDIYLRLTDYGGGKTNLVIEPFTTEVISYELLTKVKNVEIVIAKDLEYSLYFDVFHDTSALSDSNKQGILLRGKAYPLKDALRKTAHKISDDVIEYIIGEKGIASTKIVFSYRTGNNKELAIVDYDGFNFTPLTKNGRLNLFPAWAPDSKRILFSTHTKNRLCIYLFDLVKREISVISSFKGLNFAPCWSPDASKICLSLTKDGNTEIYILDLATKKLNRLTYNRAIDTSPAFSPNSREIAFVSDRTGNPQVYVMDIHGGNLRRLTFHGNYNTSPAWSPRGDIIAYVSREKDHSQQIYVTDPYDFSPVRLTYDGNNEEPSWSPDGLHIVFTSNRTGIYELYTMNWDGSRERKLTDGVTANAPDWSPVVE
jgi:TolB protein